MGSFTQKIFIEDLLCARQCCRPWKVCKKHKYVEKNPLDFVMILIVTITIYYMLDTLYVYLIQHCKADMISAFFCRKATKIQKGQIRNLSKVMY